jgi:prenylcysteine oxidase / farnesylcysteine lyase
VLHTTSSVTNQVSAHTYRAVILAAPFHSASLKVHLLDDAVLPEIPVQPYVHLYVTLLSTPNPSARTRFFGLKEKDTVPAMVLTTWERARSSDDDKPEFNSLSYHGHIRSSDNSPANLTALGLGDPAGRDESGEEWSVKIFSDHPIEDRWLRRAFGRIGWVYRKEVRNEFCDGNIRPTKRLFVPRIVGCVSCSPAHRILPSS